MHVFEHVRAVLCVCGVLQVLVQDFVRRGVHCYDDGSAEAIGKLEWSASVVWCREQFCGLVCCHSQAWASCHTCKWRYR